MTLWSRSRLENYSSCPQRYYRDYLAPGPRVPKPKADEAAVGIVTSQFLERILPHLVNGEVKTWDECLTKLKSWVKDAHEADGVLTSTEIEAVWVIEQGKQLVRRVVKTIQEAKADWWAERPIWFDENNEPIDPSLDRKAIMRRARLGGDLDVLAVSGKTGWIWDWKSGRATPKWAQLEDYALYVSWIYPKVETFRLAYMMLQRGAEGEIVKTVRKDELREIEDRLLREIREPWEAEKLMANGALPEAAFPPTPGQPQCRWCNNPCEKQDGRLEE